MSTTAPDRLRRAATLHSRNHGPVICNERPAYVLPTRPTGDNAPLAHLSDDEYALLIDQILEDWDCPTLSELGLCRAHRLTLEELDQITDDPAFDRALARIRSIREKRRPEREAAAHAQITDRLLGLLAQPQDTATRAKEVRLAAKQLLAILGAGGFQPPDRPKADAPDSTGAGGILPPNRPQADAPDSTGAGGFQPPDRPKADAPGGAGFQPAIRPQADAPGGPGFQPANRPQADAPASPGLRGGAGEVPERSEGGGGLEAPNNTPHT